jgi:hypothetical protein
MNIPSSKALTLQAEVARHAGDLETVELIERELVRSARSQGPGKKLADCVVRLALTLNLKGKFAEAEPLAREGLRLRETYYATASWQVASAQSCLGWSLVGLSRFIEAERLLLVADFQLSRYAEKIPHAYRIRRLETLRNLLKIYEVSGVRDNAAAYRSRLMALEAEAAGPSGTSDRESSPEPEE